jgi:hypothetical protein
MKKQGKQYLVADRISGSVVCPTLFSAVVEYVAQRPVLTTLVVYVLPVVSLTAIIMSVA